MVDYVISCCSTVDMDEQWLRDREIEMIPFHFSLNETEYCDDFGKSVAPAELYRRMVAGERATTSQVSAGEYADLFRRLLGSGKNVLHITLSSGISGTVTSARVAADMMKEEFPDRKVVVVDSLCASSGYGLLVDKAADLRDQGRSLEETAEWLEANKGHLHHWFITTDLTFFIMGGRVSKTAGFFGKMLNICPLLDVAPDGSLAPREKVRSKKKAISRLAEMMKIHAEGGEAYSGKCFISQSECQADARAVADLVEAAFPEMDGKVRIYPIGATIGSHTGPGTIALFFWGGDRI